MSHRQGIRFASSENFTSSSQHGIYAAGSHYSKNLGASVTSKMPLYERRASDGVLASNLPFPKNITLQGKDNQDGNSLDYLNYRMTERNFEYGAESTRYFQPEASRDNYGDTQNRRNSRSHVPDDVSSTSHSSGFNPYENMPSTDDVKTIALQMRTMPNYFAAMAAAATMNVTYPNASILDKKDAQPHTSRSSQEQERSSQNHPKYGGDRYPQDSNPDISLSRDHTQEETRGSSHVTPQLDMNSDLHDMLTTGSNSLSVQDTDDLDNPKHKYYLKVCYICKETTSKEHCIHYGALACFSCRAFFRRSHQSMQDKGLTGDGKRKLPEFACKKSGKCNVTPKTRRRCQKCRYDLCMKAGMVPDAVMTDSQVKVRFRKMFTKRGEHRNSEGEINNPSEDYEINDTDNHTGETYGHQEDEQPLTLYSQTFEQIPFGETQGNKQRAVDQNVPQEYNISSGRKETIFPYGDVQQKETRVLTAPRTQMRATSAPPPTASLVEEEEIFSSNYNYPPTNYCAKESPKIPSNECDNNSVFQNVSKKHRILGSIGNEFISNIDQSTSDLIETCNFSNKEIKSEEPESLETEMEYHPYSPEGNHNILRYNEPDIEIFTKTEVEERESEETYPTVDQLRNEILDMDAESCEALKELGEKSNTDTNIKFNPITSSNDGNVDLNETLHQMISDMENDPKHTHMLQTPGTKMEDPFSDVESSIDFSKCIEQSIDRDVKVEEGASPPHIFKSPTTLPLSIKIKKWRKKKNSRTNNNHSGGFYVGENIQTQEDKDANNNRYHRMVKRIEEINTSYKIACCQVYFPNDLAYTLINFHVGCASAQNEDFLAVANSITKFFRHFALMQRDFGNLCKSDQMLLLGKNTPLYLQFVLASYFSQPTGQAQLSTLLGKKYCSMLEGQNVGCNMLRKITVTEFCHSVHFFSSTAELSILEKLLEAFNSIKFDQAYIPFLCRMILYDTNQSTFGASTERNLERDPAENGGGFEDSLKDLKKVTELRVKSARTISFYKRELVPGSKENIPSSINSYEDTELLEQISKTIRLLGKLSMFHAYNTNWGGKHLQGNAKLSLKRFQGSPKSPSLKSDSIEKYVFHLSMPYTQEEELWLDNRFKQLKDAYASVSIGEELVNEFVMYSFDVPLSKSFFPLVHNAFLERSWRIFRKHSEFGALTLADQNMLWKSNSNKANALFMVRSQICQNGLVQLQDCIGELDNEVFCDRYLPLLKTTKLKRMPFFEAVLSSGVTLPENLISEASSLVSQIGPYVEDQEYLQLICLMQIMSPPKAWKDKPADLLSPAQINLIKIYEKYLILIHRRFKWKGKPCGSETKHYNTLHYKSIDEMDVTNGTIESGRRRKRKVSQNDDSTDSPTNKTRTINPFINKLAIKEENHNQVYDEETNHNTIMRNIFSSEDDGIKAMLKLTEDSININNNEPAQTKKYKGKNALDLNKYSEEEERLNAKTWQHFEELTAVVAKLELLSEIINQIQELLHTMAPKK